jgi:ATP-binding cassette subfamily C protein CydC
MAAQYLENNLQAVGRLFEIADAEPEVASPPRPLPLPQVYSLEVNGLWFAYPQGKGTSRVPSPTRYALQDLAFQLPEGKRLAIVGSSGAGKSTLASVLLRFWDYSQGEIRLGGQNLRLLDPAQLRSQIAVISQSPYLFNASLRDNLLLAQPKASQEALVRAAKQAEIHDFIESLPQGYDTWIGEHGLRLSGGERQRLAITRALLKDSPLLLLDEPTANLDALTERKILASLADLMECRTTILITHRLVGLEAMDEILVLEQGQVAERGCHEELLSQNGMYRHMWELQNQLWSTTPFRHKNVVT